MEEKKMWIDREKIIGMWKSLEKEVLESKKKIEDEIKEFERNLRRGEEEDIKIVIELEERKIIEVVIRKKKIVKGILKKGESILIKKKIGRKWKCEDNWFYKEREWRR